MDFDNFIIDKTKERRGEGRFGKKNQQLPSKHRAAADGKNSQKKAQSYYPYTMHTEMEK